jgi:hypothetical protein
VSDDHVRVKAGAPLKVTLVPQDELVRHVHTCQGGWTCDQGLGGCGFLMVEGVPPLSARCARCQKDWVLQGGRPFAGTGGLLVWFVPLAKGAN